MGASSRENSVNSAYTPYELHEIRAPNYLDAPMKRISGRNQIIMARLKIVLVAFTANHHNFYVFLLRTLSAKGVQVCMITNGKLRQDILDNDQHIAETIEFIVYDQSVNLYRFLHQQTSCLHPDDVVIVDEIYDRFNHYLVGLFLLRKRCRKWMIIHNVMTWFISNKSKNWKLRLSRNWMIDHSDGFIVISPNLKEFIVKMKLTEKPVFCIPFGMPKQEQLSSNPVSDNIIWFTIPGMIDIRRRDYHSVLTVFKQLWESGHHNVRLKLLGQTTNQSGCEDIVGKIAIINQYYGQEMIRYWREFVPAAEFQEEMHETHYLLSNIEVYYRNVNEVMEIYGMTKDSGISFLMTEFAKPVLSPSEFHDLEGFHEQIFKFEDQAQLLSVILGRVNHHDGYGALKEICVQNSQRFIHAMTAEFDQFSQSLLQPQDVVTISGG